MKTVIVERKMLADVAAVLHLLGKYRNNGIDTKISALDLSEAIQEILKNSEEKSNEQ